MPAGTKVHLLADALKRKGYPEGNAIAISQSKTKQSFATGKKLPTKGKKKKGKKKAAGKKMGPGMMPKGKMMMSPGMGKM